MYVLPVYGLIYLYNYSKHDCIYSVKFILLGLELYKIIILLKVDNNRI